MRRVCILLCFVVSLCSCQSSEPGLATIQGFLKTAYARIEDADTKSLAIGMRDAYRTLCRQFSAKLVAAELEYMYRSQRSDLEISIYRLKKVGFLLQRLRAEAEDDDDDGDHDQGMRGTQLRSVRLKRFSSGFER